MPWKCSCLGFQKGNSVSGFLPGKKPSWLVYYVQLQVTLSRARFLGGTWEHGAGGEVSAPGTPRSLGCCANPVPVTCVLGSTLGAQALVTYPGPCLLGDNV